MSIEVVTPGGTNLTTLETVKGELGITDNSQDARLQRLIRVASSAITSRCDRAFGKATYKETFKGDDWYQVALTHYPVVSIDSVTVGGALLDPSLYVYAGGGIIRWNGMSFAGLDIVVQYKAGYTLPGEDATPGAVELPAEIEEACLSLIKVRHTGNPGGIKSESTENYSVTYKTEEDMWNDLDATLGPWKRVI